MRSKLILASLLLAGCAASGQTNIQIAVDRVTHRLKAPMDFFQANYDLLSNAVQTVVLSANTNVVWPKAGSNVSTSTNGNTVTVNADVSHSEVNTASTNAYVNALADATTRIVNATNTIQQDSIASIGVGKGDGVFVGKGTGNWKSNALVAEELALGLGAVSQGGSHVGVDLTGSVNSFGYAEGGGSANGYLGNMANSYLFAEGGAFAGMHSSEGDGVVAVAEEGSFAGLETLQMTNSAIHAAIGGVALGDFEIGKNVNLTVDGGLGYLLSKNKTNITITLNRSLVVASPPNSYSATLNDTIGIIDARGNLTGFNSNGFFGDGSLLTNLTGSNIQIGTINSNKFDSATRAMLGGSGGSGSGFPLTSNANFATYSATNVGSISVITNATVGGTVGASGLTITNGATNLSLTASTLLQADSNKKVISIANGTGFLTNNGSGVIGYVDGNTLARTSNMVPLGPSILTNQYAYFNGDSGLTNLAATQNGQWWTNMSASIATNSAGASDGWVIEKTGNSLKLVALAGGGDVLAANNGSEYTANAATFRANVGAVSNNYGGTFTTAGSVITTGQTNQSLTASTALAADANKKIVSVANGFGVETNDGSGSIGFNKKPILDLGASTNVVSYTHEGTATNLNIVFNGTQQTFTVTNGPDVFLNFSGANGVATFQFFTNVNIHCTTTFNHFLAGSNGVSAGVYKITNGLFSVGSWGGTNADQLVPAIGEFQ